jgi:hypothetical protein
MVFGNKEVSGFLIQVEVRKQHCFLSSERGSNFKRIPSSLLHPLPLFSAMFLQPLLTPIPAPLMFPAIDHPERKLLVKAGFVTHLLQKPLLRLALFIPISCFKIFFQQK